MANFGKVGEHNESSDWTEYTERLEQFFIANDVTDDPKKRAVLLSLRGVTTYTLIRSLCRPNKPTDKTFAEIVKSHQNPKPSITMSRFKFNSCIRKVGQSVSQYIAELRKLSELCEYGDMLNDMIRDRIVCGISDEAVQKRLLQTHNLTYEKAQDLALSMEAAQVNVSEMMANTKIKEERVQIVTQKSKTPYKPKTDGTGFPTTLKFKCIRCAGAHSPEICFYKDFRCRKCNKVGHLARVCRAGQPGNCVSYAQSNEIGNIEENRVFENFEEKFPSEYDETLYKVNSLNSKFEPIVINLEVAGEMRSFELDTGASCSIISEEQFTNLKLSNELKLNPTDSNLKTYSGHSLDVCGKVLLPVVYDTQKFNLPATVVRAKGPNLLGRDWLKHIKLNWEEISEIFSLEENEQSSSTLKIVEEHNELFKEELGRFSGAKAKIYLDQGTKPIYCRARPVPLALKAKIDCELDRLESQGIVKAVEISEWATPVVPVLKADQSVRLCGDYKNYC